MYVNRPISSPFQANQSFVYQCRHECVVFFFFSILVTCRKYVRQLENEKMLLFFFGDSALVLSFSFGRSGEVISSSASFLVEFLLEAQGRSKMSILAWYVTLKVRYMTGHNEKLYNAITAALIKFDV